MLRVCVSGSFHRHMDAITRAVEDLAEQSVRVLSPADPRIVAQQGEFLFVASDPVRSVRLVQDRHLECIRAADFLWLVCTDGYVGQSASMEIGFAVACDVRIFATHTPSDLTLRQYVTRVPSLSDALRWAKARARRNAPPGILIDPHATAEKAHHLLERIEEALTKAQLRDPVQEVEQEAAELRKLLTLPGQVH